MRISASACLVAAALTLAAGCTWPWGDFEVGGMDAGPFDAGPFDAGPRVDARVDADGGVDTGAGGCPASHPDACESTEVCLRPEVLGGSCCEADHCVAPQVMGHARHHPGMLNIIDGMIDPMETVWNSARAFPLTSVSTSIPSEVVSASDWSGEVRALWNDRALFLFIDVTDDTLEATGGRDWSEKDSFEIWVDIDPRDPGPPDASEDPDELHIARSVGAGSVEFLGTNRWTVYAGVLPAPASNHWSAEVVIEWPAGRAPSEGDVIGFDLRVNDFDFSTKTVPERWTWTRCDQSRPEPQGLLELVSASSSGRACGDCPLVCNASGYPCDRASALSCDP